MLTLKNIGSYTSHYVRKVLVCLDLKGIEYEVDPIEPFLGNQAFSEISPLRRIPVLIDDGLTLCDSTVNCEYLEDNYPDVSLYPTAPADKARARWLEEYADSHMGDVFVWRYFFQLVVRRYVLGEQTDKQMVTKAVEQHIPQVLTHLESSLPTEGYFFKNLSIADIATASFFKYLFFAGYKLDAERWPRIQQFLNDTLGKPCFQKLH